MVQNNAAVTVITSHANMSADVHGCRAKCLQRLIRLDLPVPVTVALSFECVFSITLGELPNLNPIVEPFGQQPLLSVRPSSQDPDWGGPSALLNIGMCDQTRDLLSDKIGDELATRLYVRFVCSYAEHVARLDPEMFDVSDLPPSLALSRVLAAYEDEMDEPFPQDIRVQLAEVLRSMARVWNGTSARLLRQAKGAPVNAGLGLVVQQMALGVGPQECGTGLIQYIDAATGEPSIVGRYKGQSQRRQSLVEAQGALYLTKDERGPSLQEHAPGVFKSLLAYGDICRTHLKEEMQVEFVVEANQLYVLDAVRVPRAPRAAVKTAVALAADGVISKQDAVLRVDPSILSELLHRQIDPSAHRDVLASGIAASPGAASGRVALTANEAQAYAAQGEPCVLVRRETTPEDIRGMHAAQAVLTMRGGVTSHAAVIGRGIGVPCVVGAADLVVDLKSRTVTTPDGGQFTQGDIITVDGSSGDILAGAAPMVEASLDDAFRTLLEWADEFRDIGVRANADTPRDAQTARNFAADGIGLCRTEHMFFEGDRLGVMREMIFADDDVDRGAVLERLLPMQRTDFAQILNTMRGMPVCVRLLDPPLHEFIPSDKAGLRAVAEQLSLSQTDVMERVAELREHNPMLGMRGVRLGIVIPEIYEMQARALFEAVVDVHGATPEVPEIMIPVVSAMREVELVKGRIDAVAAAVSAERKCELTYKLGVMVETPRAALRAEDIAQHSEFLSFGTNDLTQMTYGLSRDDAGRFMSAYVQQGVYPEDPFHTLDLDGVGELLSIGAERGRKGRADIMLSVCGEHGGTREAIEFCRQKNFDYVSCSPFRVPGARLSAAQLALRAQSKTGVLF